MACTGTALTSSSFGYTHLSHSRVQKYGTYIFTLIQKYLKVKLQSVFTLYDLYHVHTTINIPTLYNEVECPRQQQYVTVIRPLIKRAAVVLGEQHGQIQYTMD